MRFILTLNLSRVNKVWFLQIYICSYLHQFQMIFKPSFWNENTYLVPPVPSKNFDYGQSKWGISFFKTILWFLKSYSWLPLPQISCKTPFFIFQFFISHNFFRDFAFAHILKNAFFLHLLKIIRKFNLNISFYEPYTISV